MYARDTNRKPRLLISGNHTHLATVYSLNIIRTWNKIDALFILFRCGTTIVYQLLLMALE